MLKQLRSTHRHENKCKLEMRVVPPKNFRLYIKGNFKDARELGGLDINGRIIINH